ncbi:MAG: hypothetical protein H6733_13530 [Alphaproteobacteria bacterium]|nr:hypothetical protein [Alphaproteobacteria bacterium]
MTLGAGTALAAASLGTWWLAHLDVALLGVAALPAAIAAWAWQRRQDRRPLALAPVAVLDGGVLRVRACLGTGRIAGRPQGTIAWSHGGRTTPLPTWPLPPRVTGPFTVCAPLPPGVVLDGGELRVAVTCDESDHTWQTEATYAVAALSSGRFPAPLVRTRRGWSLNVRGWDRAE